MNFIQKLNDGLWLQSVQQIAGMSKVMLPLAGAAHIYDILATNGKTARRNGDNVYVEEGCSIYALCVFLKHNDDESYYFSPSKNALYKGCYTIELPEDAVTITEQEWTELVSGINDREIYINAKGRPALAEYSFPTTNTAPEYTIEYLMPEIRQYRNNYMQNMDNAVLRHRRQLDLEVATTLTSAEYRTLLLFIQELCDFVSGLDKAAKIRSVTDLAWPSVPESIRGKI